MEFFTRLFDTSGFPARWHCGSGWTETPYVGWLNILADLGIWSAYLAIPCVLAVFILERRDLPFRKIFLLFGAFILACGTTHLMEAIIFWWPAYRFAGLIKLFTAIISWATVVALVSVVPRVLKLRSPEELEREIAARTNAENALRATNAELQEQVEALGRSEERFRLLVEGAKDHAIFMLDPAGNVSSWNRGAERIKQYQAEEIIGQHFSCFYLAADVQSGKPNQELQMAAVEGRYEDEGWRVRKNGSQFYANVVITALRDATGNVHGFSKITRDITEKKQAEENTHRLLREEAARKAAEEQALAIHEQRERLRVTLTSIGDAVISTDAEARVTFLNPVAEDLTGWTSEEAHGSPLETVFKIVNEESRQPVENPALRALREGVIVGLANHTLLIAKNGMERPIDDSAAPIRDSAGDVFGSVLVFRDVSHQRRAETTNRILADISTALVGPLHYQSILRQVAEVTIPVLGDICFIDVLTNDERLERVVWKHAEPAKAELSDKVRNFVPSKDSKNHPVAKVLRTGQPELNPEVTEAFLREIATSDEHLEYLHELNMCSMLTVPLSVGQRRLGALTFAYSESCRRHTSDALNLATEIARRLALMIENAKLFNQLRDADRKKNEFLAVLAHELRNPLAPIANALQLMRLGTDNAGLAPLREMMERQIQQMTHLVDDLLDVSRITSGKIVLRKERIDLSQVVEIALEATRPLIDAAKQELTVTMSEPSLQVEGDRTRLAQVLSNLLANAAKYTPEAGRIWLSVSRDGEHALIRVRDTGMGIPAEMLPLVFQMFTQVSRNLGRSQGGLGIGLALVRRLVEMHGGTVEAQSDGPGKGSEFVVRLPQATDPPERQEIEAQVDTLERDRTAPAKRRILVVDDNKDSAETLGMLLGAMGNEVRIAHDGPEALETAAAFLPHVVLLDIGLPGMSGYDVARRMRQLPEVKDAVLVAQTGWGQEEDKRQSEEAGFDAHLVKPVDFAELKRLLAGLSIN